MFENETIIIETWAPLRNYMKRRPTHYAELLARNNRVINVSSAPLSHYFRYRDHRPWEEKIFFRLHGTRFALIRKINDLLYKRHFERVIAKLDQKPLLWHFTSLNYHLVKSVPARVRVLEICDDTPEYFAVDPEKYNYVKKSEEDMTLLADVVFTISDNLKQKRSYLRNDVQVVRNGVRYEDFCHVPGLAREPGDLLYHLAPPLAGYCGAISKWLDYGLIRDLAIAAPEVNFVFAGRIAPEVAQKVESLSDLPNLHFVGERPYSELPHLIKYFDVCLIPFVIDELIKSVNPIKLYEYLAAGRKTLSTPLPEVVASRKEGIIETAEGAEEFCRTLKHMLGADPALAVAECQRIARDHTWEQRVESACEAIRRLTPDMP